MSQLQQFRLPDAGEGLTEAEILSWRVSPGEQVSVNQIIVEIETAKAAVELPCPFAGVVTELLVDQGQTVDVGTPIITIDTAPGATGGPAPSAPDGVAHAAGHNNGTQQPAEERISTLVGYGPRTGSVGRRPRKAAAAQAATVREEPVEQVPPAKPPVRKLARDLGVDLRDLHGSGRNGVITREDVEAAANGGVAAVGMTAPAEPVAAVAPAAPEAPAAPVGAAPSGGARERRVPIRGVRKATAQAVVGSFFTAPHVTEFYTVDVTPMMELRARLRTEPEFAGVKLTPLAFAAKAVCLAIRRTPDVNATWDEAAEEIVYKDYVHLGIAAATPRGLVVPKVRDVDRMSLREIAVALDELTTTAREGRTTPADMVGGTFTITNVGVFGVDTGTPIINPGESAILAFGAIRDMPWVVDGQVVPRKVCQLALSFDHRVVDGQQGSQFLADVGTLLADPTRAILY